MKKSIFIVYCLLSIVYWSPAFSQVKPKNKKTIRADILTVRPIANKAFATTFTGVFAANVCLSYSIKNFNIGPYYNILQCQIFPTFASDPHSILTAHTGGVRIQYDFYPSKENMASKSGNYIVVTPFLTAGYAWLEYTRLLAPTPPQQIMDNHPQTYNVYVGSSFTLMFSEYDGIGVTVGYGYYNKEFNPVALGLTPTYYPNITDSQMRGDLQYLFFGFNWYVYLGKRKEIAD